MSFLTLLIIFVATILWQTFHRFKWQFRWKFATFQESKIFCLWDLFHSAKLVDEKYTSQKFKVWNKRTSTGKTEKSRPLYVGYQYLFVPDGSQKDRVCFQPSLRVSSVNFSREISTFWNKKSSKGETDKKWTSTILVYRNNELSIKIELKRTFRKVRNDDIFSSRLVVFFKAVVVFFLVMIPQRWLIVSSTDDQLT